jgi:hypothetical protein
MLPVVRGAAVGAAVLPADIAARGAATLRSLAPVHGAEALRLEAVTLAILAQLVNGKVDDSTTDTLDNTLQELPRAAWQGPRLCGCLCSSEDHS